MYIANLNVGTLGSFWRIFYQPIIQIYTFNSYREFSENKANKFSSSVARKSQMMQNKQYMLCEMELKVETREVDHSEGRILEEKLENKLRYFQYHLHILFAKLNVF